MNQGVGQGRRYLTALGTEQNSPTAHEPSKLDGGSEEGASLAHGRSVGEDQGRITRVPERGKTRIEAVRIAEAVDDPMTGPL